MMQEACACACMPYEYAFVQRMPLVAKVGGKGPRVCSYLKAGIVV